MNGDPLYFVCKYTPLELLKACGADVRLLDYTPENFSNAEQAAHPNLCGFGKSVLEAVLRGGVKELVIVNCCDTLRSVYETLDDMGIMNFLYFLDLSHDEGECAIDLYASELEKLVSAYTGYAGTDFDPAAFEAAFEPVPFVNEPYIGIMGARTGEEMFRFISSSLPMRCVNLSCVSGRKVEKTAAAGRPLSDVLKDYAAALIRQTPCMRMNDIAGRRALTNDPYLKAIVYSTIKFCDYYSFEYSVLKNECSLPLLKIETDHTLQSEGQLRTRLEAFGEQLEHEYPRNDKDETKENKMKEGLYAGIDSGSTSTDVIIMDHNKKIVAAALVPTGSGARSSAEKALQEALSSAGIDKSSLVSVVATGYGRDAVGADGKSITEISCHARGAFFLDPSVRTIIDIGGQDSKVIVIDDSGNVANFVMNDKCAAGTGRFLDIMARTLELNMEEFSKAGLTWKENITISNMCTVFAESEIVSLIARNKAVPDIIHGLNVSVASKAAALVKRAGGSPAYMMTGGVAKNTGVVKAIEEQLSSPVAESGYSQFCGAIGAALYAMEG